MDKIIIFYDFALECEYFEWGKEEEGTADINGGYLCNHPEQEEKHYCDNIIGECHCYSCLLGHEVGIEDFEDDNIDNNGWEENEDGLFVVYDT